jgi:hypothetical protein
MEAAQDEMTRIKAGSPENHAFQPRMWTSQREFTR